MAAHAEEECAFDALRVALSGSQQIRSSALEVLLERGDGLVAEGDDALLVALAAYLCARLIEMQVLLAQGAELADAQAASVEKLEDGVIAQGQRIRLGMLGGGGGALEHLRDLPFGERLGQDLPGRGRLDIQCGIVGDLFVEQQPAIEAAQAAEFARDGARLDAVAAQPLHEAADVLLQCRR